MIEALETCESPMRNILIAITGLCLSAPALAHDPEPLPPAAPGAAADDVARTLGDPVRQQALARTLSTMSDVILDMPLAPIARPLAEAAGQDPRAIDPDTTLRQMAPGAGEVSGAIRHDLPRAMDRMAQMSDAIARLAPALQAAAREFADALPPQQ